MPTARQTSRTRTTSRCVLVRRILPKPFSLPMSQPTSPMNNWWTSSSASTILQRSTLRAPMWVLNTEVEYTPPMKTNYGSPTPSRTSSSKNGTQRNRSPPPWSPCVPSLTARRTTRSTSSRTRTATRVRPTLSVRSRSERVYCIALYCI